MNKGFIFFYIFLIFLFLSNCGKRPNKKLAQTYYKLGVLELNENKAEKQAYKKALDYIEKAIEQVEMAEYLAFKATLLFKLDQEEQGFECFQQALDANPNSEIKAEILNNKACLLAQSGIKNNKKEKLNQAIGIWQALENDKDYLTPEVACFNQAKVAVEQKDFELAKEKLNKTIESAPNFLDAHYYLSQVAYKLNDLKLAKNEINTVLFLEPEHQGARQFSIILQKK